MTRHIGGRWRVYVWNTKTTNPKRKDSPEPTPPNHSPPQVNRKRVYGDLIIPKAIFYLLKGDYKPRPLKFGTLSIAKPLEAL